MSTRFIAVRSAGQLEVHAVGAPGDYATLCGLDGTDDHEHVAQSIESLPSRPKIDCPQCIQIIIACRSYKLSDLKREVKS